LDHGEASWIDDMALGFDAKKRSHIPSVAVRACNQTFGLDQPTTGAADNIAIGTKKGYYIGKFQIDLRVRPTVACVQPMALTFENMAQN
jgi:hypothetical protein